MLYRHVFDEISCRVSRYFSCFCKFRVSATARNIRSPEYGRQHKLNYNSMPSALSLEKKLHGRRLKGKGKGVLGARETRFSRSFSAFHFGLKVRRARPPGPFLWIRHCVVTSRHGHVLSIQFGDNHVVWSEANYYCS